MINHKYAIAQLNQMSQTEFTNTLGEIWEATPKIAEQAWQSKPFADVEVLYQAMVVVVNNMSESEQLALIKAHPDLGSKAKMPEASIQEQTEVGLNDLSESEYQYFQLLNQAYQDQFGFPFIVAVKYHTKESILETFKCRLKNNQEQEKREAIAEIIKIARLRLESLCDFSRNGSVAKKFSN
jgi:2-oxo-4-hydroxy-4-carboxy-5-ureidoimidazoline decarboxylase